jgi:NADPH-dependent 2,4-dienoyl-CoA reductase/sulfur reductase-like enzyme
MRVDAPPVSACHVTDETGTGTFDVLVIGAGPAGMAAATEAALAGAGRVALLDDNPAPGGQIWRGEAAHPSPHLRERFAGLERAGVTPLFGRRVVARPDPDALLVEDLVGLVTTIRARRIILATGSRELFLPFPGWTLPGVVGAGAMQALVKTGLDVRGQRVLIAGSGPLLFAVAELLRRKGATVVGIVEQTTLPRLAMFLVSLAGLFPSKFLQAIALRARLAAVPFLTGAWPIRADSKGPSDHERRPPVTRHDDVERLRTVTVQHGGRRRTFEVDWLACGFGLVPNLELAELLGVRTSGGVITVDDHQRTSLPGVYAAGEVTGVGGVDKSLVEGTIAGRMAARAAEPDFATPDARVPREDATSPDGSRTAAMEPARTQTRDSPPEPSSLRVRDRWRRFADLLATAYAARAELRTLADDDTIVCRCEDVPFSRLTDQPSARSAKLHTRCGMGPCQGRVCGPATRFLFGWDADRIRPPIFPVRLGSLVDPNADR